MIRSGILLIPFQNDARRSPSALQLGELEEWLIRIAASCDVELKPVRDVFDGSHDILRRITDAIENAALVVAVLADLNPNVLFEAGYAYALKIPILYVMKEGEELPFDIRGFECYFYHGFGESDSRRLRHALKSCLLQASERMNTSARLLTRLGHFLFRREFSPRLYQLCIEHHLTSFVNWVENWGERGPLECRGPQRILETGVFILENLQTGGFATLYYPGEASWQPDSDQQTNDEYLNRMREFASRGKLSIARVYVLHDETNIHERRFWQLIQEDMESGIEALYIFEKDLPTPLARDFGLWDDELFCEVHYATDIAGAAHLPRMTRCTYYSDAQHLTEARKWRGAILAKAFRCPSFPSERLLLEESCHEQHAFAARHCSGSQVDQDDCSWYHGSWQYLRLCNLVSSPSWHSEFYRETIEAWFSSMQSGPSKNRELRILVSGLADYSMLYHVIQGIGAEELSRCTLHVLDLCQTPLDMCRWLQQRLQRKPCRVALRLELHKTSILDSSLVPESFDLIISDAFLTRFAADEEKEKIYATWIDLLRPEGWIITTARVRTIPHELLAPVEARAAFVARAVERATQLHLSPELAQMAQAYANRISSYPFEGEERVRTFLHRFEAAVDTRMECHLLEEYELILTTYARIVSRRLSPERHPDR